MNLSTDFSDDKYCSQCNRNVKFESNGTKCYYICHNYSCKVLQSKSSNIITCTNCVKGNNGNQLYVWNNNHAYKYVETDSIKGSSERPSVNVNIKSNSNNKQFQSSKRNKKLQNILPLQKIEIVSKKCICGNALTQMKVIDEKYCNNPVCYNYDNPIKLNKLVWHCKRGQIAEHPQGFDICNH